ncbi:putative Propionate catabolism operon transcriptional regulator of GntR family [Vibrio nigripulchritudo SFn27]|uniref:Putative Propionate catabolism operon transcriptional regulator of GntR family n=1 Tax=Vibrio nigripulchritudo TaxID=28173 RepID=U4KFL2_9VIBR|nr:GntR family transcriptional regulator [Vibrio nigripulchritudo]CCN81436.1 putative Propionate catabolism operon transcriptional regulator of GntR family [Vibrio nigripulchritudo BLFn1]CCN88891.1 putative Propionate catabolism operon transcriptional regulator of GntR family [Vibrio nigripulchritudo SFn27]CCN96693.1 putative Propionate catabolism operon transcriptional regulator of GntR family [Vibrio nigripulchritudo ENn2]CCO39104.1 putative Propionate catabolism operon transcriptional regula
MSIAAPEKEATKSENLTSSLVEAIVEGQIAPGSKISEPELAKRFNVSRGPLREAIMRLEGLGLIERIPHVGARVIHISLTHLSELYAVREALEGMAARLAARYITDEEIEGLSQLLSTHSDHIEQVEGSSYFHQHGDFDFHYRIIKASRNSKLVTLLCDELYHLLRMYRYQSPRSHSRPEQALEEHKFILKAIQNRDEELAEMLMRRHISCSRQLIEQQIQQEIEA